MDWLTSPEIWISLLTLTALEIVLGIDNVVFISILAGKLPKHQREKARKIGLGLALVTRVILLLCVSWIVKLDNPFAHIPVFWSEHALEISGKSLILFLGGLFLIAKATGEIHDKVEGVEHGADHGSKKASFNGVILQILALDTVFSLDSVITAVGMVDQIPVMIAAVTIALVFMLVFAKWISSFIERHPTFKILALSFLVLVGFVLVMEGLEQKIPKGYIYFAMAFSVGVEMINMRYRSSQNPLKLRSKLRAQPEE